MKILLLYPRFRAEPTYRPPLGLAYLSTILKEEGHEVTIKDATFYRNFKEFEQDVKEIKPDIFGVSTPSALLKRANESIRIVKQICPKAVILMGGPHPTAMPRDALQNKQIDAIVLGEAERTLPELVNAIDKKKQEKDFRKIKGIGYHYKNKIIITGPRLLLKDLSKFPWPDRDALEMDKYLAVRPFMPMPYPSTYIIAGRGCPGNCFFCQPILRKMSGKTIRNREVKDVVDEIEFVIKKYKVRSINLGCDHPTANKEWTHKFCDEIIKRKIKTIFNIPIRVDSVDYPLLKKMKRAGITHLTFGVESGSPEMLIIMRKGFKIQKAIEAFRLCNEVGITTQANLMVGTPGETLDTIKGTIDFIHKAKPDFISVNVTLPSIGSDMYDQLVIEEKLLADFIDDSGLVAGYIKLDNFTTSEIKQQANRIIGKYKKELVGYVLNPFRKLHLFRDLARYWISLLKEPSLFKEALRVYSHYERRIKVKAK